MKKSHLPDGKRPWFGFAGPALVGLLSLWAGSVAAQDGVLGRAAPLPTLFGGEGQRLEIDWLNEFVQQNNDQDTLLLDSETVAMTVSDEAIKGDWQLKLRFPMYLDGGGALDGPIEDWHAFAGLPNGGREQRPQNRYQVTYAVDGTPLVDLNQGGLRLGALQTQLGYRLSDHWQAVGLLQWGTGEARTLGGGRWGMGLGLNARSRHWQWQNGLSWQQQSGPLGPALRPWLAWSQAQYDGPIVGLADAWRVLARLEAHTALYRATLPALNRPTVAGTLGMGYRWSSRWQLGLSVQEDLVVETSPDVLMRLWLHYAPPLPSASAQ